MDCINAAKANALPPVPLFSDSPNKREDVEPEPSDEDLMEDVETRASSRSTSQSLSPELPVLCPASNPSSSPPRCPVSSSIEVDQAGT